MDPRIRTALLTGILVLAAGTAGGGTLSGRLTTSAYTWQSQAFDGSEATHLRIYQSVRLSASQLGSTPLSVHAYLQVSGDPLSEVSGRDNFRLYHAYLKWQSPDRYGLDIRAGRQRIFAGVGYGTVDGLKATVQPHAYLTVSGYAGVLVPLMAEDGVGTWDEGHLWGGRAQLQVRETWAAVSFAERAREPVPYTRAGRYTGLILKGPAEQFRRLGLDLRQGFNGRAEAFGRLDYDLEAEQIHEVAVGATLRPTPELEVTGEYQHREPTIFLNSILSVFELSDDREVSGRLNYRLGPQVRVHADVARVAFEGETSWRTGAGVSVGNAYLGYTRRIGYGGENDAVTASVQHPVAEDLTVRASGSFSGYRLHEGLGDRNRALAGALGIGYRPRRTVTLDAEAQFLNNEFYGRDLRLFVRGSLWFFKRSK